MSVEQKVPIKLEDKPQTGIWYLYTTAKRLVPRLNKAVL